MCSLLKSKKKNEKNKNILEKKAVECLDRCLNKNQESHCREIIRHIKSVELSVSTQEKVLLLLDDALTALKLKELNSATYALEKANEISIKNDRGSESMGVFSRIKNKLSKQEEVSQVKMIDSANNDAEDRIHKLEWDLAKMYDLQSRLMKTFQEKAQKCVGLSKSDSEYKLNKQQAMILAPRIKSLAKTVNSYTQMLNKSARYQAMLEAGKANLELKKMMPDLNKAEAMMGWIVDGDKQVADYLNDFDSDLDQFERAMGLSTGFAEEAGDDEFDKLVAALNKTGKESGIKDTSAKSETISETTVIDTNISELEQDKDILDIIDDVASIMKGELE